MSKKPIIVFEGIESSGKTLHINNVARYLKKNSINYIKIREPGGSKTSEKIRKILENKIKKSSLYLFFIYYRNPVYNFILKLLIMYKTAFEIYHRFIVDNIVLTIKNYIWFCV